MLKQNLKYILLIIFFIALLPLVITLYNKQKELTENITPYDEYIAEYSNPQQEDLYEEYMTSVLGAYDERAPRDETVETILSKITDIVEKFDDSRLQKITPEVRLPTLDLTEDVQFELGNGESVTVRDSGRYAILLYNEKKVDRIIGEEELSLHIYNENALTYPTVIVGTSEFHNSVERKVLYCLVDGRLSRYDSVDSLQDLELYIDEDTKEEKLVTYWRDRNIEGDLVTVWTVNHDTRDLERDYTVLELRK